MDALAFFGAFALPLLASEAIPAVLALLLLLGARGWRASIRNPLLAAAFGWLVSWILRFDGTHLWQLVDLALVGPGLAFGATNRSRPLRAGLLTGGAVCALAALLQAFSDIFMPSHWTGSYWPWGRAAGTLGNPNVAGACLAAILPFALALERPQWLRRLLCGIIGAALLATGSRGGWFAASAAVAYLLWRERSAHLFPFLASALAVAILPWPPGARFLAGISLRDPTVKARLMLWRRAFALFLARPLSGWGCEAPLGWGAHPHNLFLEILLTGGVTAVSGFLALAIRLRGGLFRRDGSGAKRVPGASLVALLAFGMADAVLTTPVLAAFFWLNVGMLLGEGANGDTELPASASGLTGGSGGSGGGGVHLPSSCGGPFWASSARDNPEPGDGDPRPE